MSTRKRRKPTPNKKQACNVNVKMSKQDIAVYRNIADKNYQGKTSPVSKV